MSTFVLVHGSWAGGWIWSPFVTVLQQAGHTVHAPTLTGLGIDSTNVRADLRLEDHIAVVTEVLDTIATEDVVMVGHSYGGVIATGAALSESGRSLVRHLVFLDAFIPETGRSIHQMHPEVEAVFDSLAVAHGGVYAEPASPTLLGVNEPEVVDWITEGSTLMPMSLGQQPFPATTRSLDDLDKEAVTYIRFTGTDYFKSSMDSAVLRQWRVREVHGSHFAFVTQPATVAAELSR